ncbi:hypothetical protein V8J88_05040 [Massilia sp. W12]|uniref:hypothetical protein n=1 Tax=Massilia sp. W12 TaxID=3126507 RepID=UPI0030CDAC12
MKILKTSLAISLLALGLNTAYAFPHFQTQSTTPDESVASGNPGLGQSEPQTVSITGQKEKNICVDDAPTGSRIMRKKRCEELIVVRGAAKDRSVELLMEENLRNRMLTLLPPPPVSENPMAGKR